MHFAAILEIAAKLYNMPELAAEAYVIRETVRKQSWNGKFFVDNAVRKDGKLVLSGESTEVCQYFAFYFNVVSPETHPELWNTLVNDFGPKRKLTKTWPEIHMANQLIGNVMRLELLSRYGGNLDKILDESIEYLSNGGAQAPSGKTMATMPAANHGFASHEIVFFTGMFWA
jgi:hypothetical protein